MPAAASTAARKPRTTTRTTVAPAPEAETVQPKKAKKAKHNPLKGRALHVTFKGVAYDLQASDVDDLEIFELIEDGKAVTALRQILGPERWATFKESARGENGRVTMATTNDFLNAIMSAIGGDRGN